ncbi:hypothetical protein HK405_015425 [Cladochytrium tenue]|nr:hypothetical protein HK405_015425 [Cladochytrium tenue]
MSDTATANSTEAVDAAWQKPVGVSLALASGFLVGASFILKKKGLLRAVARHAVDGELGNSHVYLKSPMWWLGMVLMALGEIANFGAYAFVPAILVTPLGALSVVVSAVLSAILLQEHLSFSGKVGCAQCIIGAVIIVLHAPASNATHTIPEFFSYVLYPSFGAALVHSATHWNDDNQFRQWLTYPLLGFVGLTVCAQVHFLNRALDRFSTAIVTPVYYVFFTTATLTSSAVLFRGFAVASAADAVSIVLGFLTIVAGVALLFQYSLELTRRATAAAAADAKDSEAGKLDEEDLLESSSCGSSEGCGGDDAGGADGSGEDVRVDSGVEDEPVPPLPSSLLRRGPQLTSAPTLGRCSVSFAVVRSVSESGGGGLAVGAVRARAAAAAAESYFAQPEDADAGVTEGEDEARELLPASASVEAAGSLPPEARRPAVWRRRAHGPSPPAAEAAGFPPVTDGGELGDAPRRPSTAGPRLTSRGAGAPPPLPPHYPHHPHNGGGVLRGSGRVSPQPDRRVSGSPSVGSSNGGGGGPGRGGSVAAAQVPGSLAGGLERLVDPPAPRRPGVGGSAPQRRVVSEQFAARWRDAVV